MTWDKLSGTFSITRANKHSSCPDWCCAATDLPRSIKNRLPAYVCTLIKPLFECLAFDELLFKYLHGRTQNTNVAFHHFIWARCPNIKFAGFERIKLATAVTTIAFNDGYVGLLDWFAAMGVGRGKHHVQYAIWCDRKRINKAERSVKDTSKRRQSDRIKKYDYNPGGHYTVLNWNQIKFNFYVLRTCFCL